MSEELKPCPFCGGDNKHMDDCYIPMLIECVEREQFFDADYENKLEKAWNTRAERTCKNVYDETEMGACENGFECSECGEMVEDCEGYHVKGTWNYCPNCGAKVVEVV